jgi:hypothetical protein
MQVTTPKMLKQDSNIGHRLWHVLLGYAAEGHFEIKMFIFLRKFDAHFPWQWSINIAWTYIQCLCTTDPFQCNYMQEVKLLHFV